MEISNAGTNGMSSSCVSGCFGFREPPAIQSATVVGDQWLYSLGIASLLKTLSPNCDCQHLTAKEWLVAGSDGRLAASDVFFLAADADLLQQEEFLKQLAKLAAVSRVVFMSFDELPRGSVVHLYEAGVAACLSFSESIETICHVLALVMSGRRYFDLGHLAATAAAERPISPGASVDAGHGGRVSAKVELSRRQQDVARLMMKGASNKEISRSLGISIGTAKNYVADVLLSLGVGSRVKAAVLLADALDGRAAYSRHLGFDVKAGK